MSVFTDQLTPETQAQIIQDRIQQFSREGYSHELRVQEAMAAGADEIVAESKAAIHVLTAAVESGLAELAKLEAEDPQLTTAPTEE